jgi:hypothetical protein
MVGFWAHVRCAAAGRDAFSRCGTRDLSKLESSSASRATPINAAYFVERGIIGVLFGYRRTKAQALQNARQFGDG